MMMRKNGDYFLHAGYPEPVKAFLYRDCKQFDQCAHISGQEM